VPRAFTNCCATRTFPSCIYFNRRAKHFPCGTPHVSIQRKGGHASASNFPELCDSDGLRHHPSKFRVFARVSGNVGTTNGLHARRLAAVRRASPRCGQNRACLRRNTPQLSGQCRAVFEQGDNAPRRGEDRDYGQRRYDRDYGRQHYDRDYGPRRYDDDE